MAVTTQRSLSLIIPVYFNEDTIPLLARDLLQFENRLKALGVALELIFVDDGSGDASFQRLIELKTHRAATKVIRLSRNFGAPAAVKAGMNFVTGDCFMFFAADLQEPLNQVELMVQEWLLGEKLVLSVRLSRGDPLATRVFAALFRGLVRMTVSRTYPSGGVGLVLMDKVMLEPMRSSAKNINPNVYAYWLGFSPKLLQYHRAERPSGKSRWTFSKRFQYLLDTITGFSVVPIRFITSIGLVLATVSFVYGAFIFIVGATRGISVSGFTTIVTLNAFLGGCILFMLGIIGEYVWRIFNQVSGRPEAVIAEIYE